MVFPWSPFFVYPETTNRKHQRKNRQKFQEEILEVRAVTADPIFLTQQQSSSNEMAQLQILCQRKPMATSMRMRLNRLKDERDRKLSLTKQKIDNDASILMAKSTLMKEEVNGNLAATIHSFGTVANEEDGQFVDGQREMELKGEELPKGTSFENVEAEKSKPVDEKDSEFGEQIKMKIEERKAPLELESTPSSAIDVLAITNEQSATAEECTLLPKAPTEHLRVEFNNKDSKIVEMNDENGENQENQKTLEGDKNDPSTMEKLLVQPHSVASTSSSSAGTEKLAPRSGSTGKISNKMRGTSGSRSGTSSAKQSPRPIHRSTDSIASALRQTEKKATVESATTPIAQRRRKSAFETSQAMRDLFGRTEDSPFAGLATNKSRNIGQLEKKEDEIKSEGKRENEAGMGLEGSEIDEKKRLTPSQLESCAQMDSATLPIISSTTTLQCHESITTMTAAPCEWPSRKRSIEVEEADAHLNKDEEEIGKEIEERKIQIDVSQEREKLQNQTNPNQQTQRSNSRTRSVARVAPFAYFPPQEEQRIIEQFSPQQTSTIGIPLGSEIVNNHQVFYNGEVVSAITRIVQPEIEREIIKESIKANGAIKDKNSEEEKHFEKEEGKSFKSEQPIQHQEHWPNNTERRHNGNGHLKSCAIAEQTNNNNKVTNSDKTINLTTNLLEQQIGSLPGDNKPSKRSAISFGGPNGSVEKGGGRRNGHQKEETRNGIGGGGGGVQGGGGGSGGGPPANLEPLKMVNDSANGTAGGNGNGICPQLLIRNATVLNDDECFLANVLIEEGIIREISLESIKNIGPQCEQIDAEGKCLLPAGIDVHTKLLGESDSIGQGTKAALKGGTGTIIDVLNVRPEETGDLLLTSFERAISQIANSAECNVGLSVPIGKWRGDQTRQDILRLTERGVNSFLADLPSDSELCELLEYTKSIGAFCRVSAKNKQFLGLLGQRLQNQHISSSSMQIANKFETNRVQQLCNLAELTNSPLVVQMLSIGSNSHDIAMAIKSSTAIVGAELSAKSELFESLACHPNLVCISGNSAMDSIEQRMALIWEKMVLTGKMDPMRFVSVLSTNAAKMFNLYPRKGRIAVGSDADLVLWDLQGANVQKSFKLVILGGRIRFRQSQFNSIANESPKFERIKGMFLPMTLNSPHLFGLIRLREKTFNFADFRHNQQQSAVTSHAGSLQSTRTGTPDEVSSGTNRPGSQNRNAQSDQQASRATTKIIHPPGGKSSAFW